MTRTRSEMAAATLAAVTASAAVLAHAQTGGDAGFFGPAARPPIAGAIARVRSEPHARLVHRDAAAGRTVRKHRNVHAVGASAA